MDAILLTATLDATGIGSLLLGAAGLIGAIAAILRLGRDDESMAVKTQSTVLVDMKSLNDELIEALERCREERLRSELELSELKTRHSALVARLRALGEDV